VAGKSFELKQGAFISAPGAGGGQGGTLGQEASGGGSGGAILIESEVVTIAGTIAVNGGGGGSGAGSGAGAGKNGDDGHDSDATPASGGVPSATDHGGNGAAGDTPDGDDGLSSTGESGAEGGGVGRVRINTASGLATVSGLVTPSAKSGCLSQGALKK
jgi:hypothetical protein